MYRSTITYQHVLHAVESAVEVIAVSELPAADIV